MPAVPHQATKPGVVGEVRPRQGLDLEPVLFKEGTASQHLLPSSWVSSVQAKAAASRAHSLSSYSTDSHAIDEVALALDWPGFKESEAKSQR